MQIGELSARTGASVRMLRYYEEHGLLEPERTESGYRVYQRVRCAPGRACALHAGLGVADQRRPGGRPVPPRRSPARAGRTGRAGTPGRAAADRVGQPHRAHRRSCTAAATRSRGSSTTSGAIRSGRITSCPSRTTSVRPSGRALRWRVLAGRGKRRRRAEPSRAAERPLRGRGAGPHPQTERVPGRIEIDPYVRPAAGSRPASRRPRSACAPASSRSSTSMSRCICICCASARPGQTGRTCVSSFWNDRPGPSVGGRSVTQPGSFEPYGQPSSSW